MSLSQISQKHIAKSIDFRHFFNANRFKFQSDQRSYKLDQLKEKCKDLFSPSSDTARHELLRELENDVENFKWIMRNGKSSSSSKDLFSSYRKIYNISNLLQQEQEQTRDIARLDFKDHCDFLNVLLLNKSPALSAKFLNDHLLNTLYQFNNLDARQLNAILLIFLQAGQLDKVKLHFDYIQSMWGQKPNIHAFNTLQTAYLMEGRHDMVEATWKSSVSMWPELYYLNQEGWALLIESKTRQADLSGAVELYETLSSNLPMFIPVENGVYEAMIRAFALGGCLDKALGLFDSLNLSAAHFLQESAATGSRFKASSPSTSTTPAATKKKDFERFDHCLLTYDAVIQACFEANEPQLGLYYFEKCLEFCRAVDKVTQVLEKPASPFEKMKSIQNCENVNQSSSQSSSPPPLPNLSSLFPPRKQGYLPHLKNQHPLPQTLSCLLDHFYATKQYDLLLAWHHYFLYYVRISPRARQQVLWAYLNTGNRELAVREWKRMVGGYIVAERELSRRMQEIMQELEEEKEEERSE